MSQTATIDTGFPLHPELHGTELITIRVGQAKWCRSFKVHKEVLCKSSKFFNGALHNGFKEDDEGTIKLDDQDPIAFSVLYHYLYSGSVQQADFYTKNRITDDVLWLRTFKLADATMMQPLLHIAYDRIRGLFKSSELRHPSVLFAHELYDPEYPQEKLAEYIVAHSAYFITHNLRFGAVSYDWQDWVKLIDSVAPFGLDVGRQVAKVGSRKYTGFKDHPDEDPRFDKYILFPNPPEPVEDMMVLEGEVPGAEKQDGQAE